jgi:hypothetical protein
VVSVLHRQAPTLAGQPVEAIEARLKEQEDYILNQCHVLDEQLSRWKPPPASPPPAP